jgi:hypothetical protein
VIDPERFLEYIAVHPVLYHVTPARNVEPIRKEGLRPGSELGVSTLDNFFKPRPGHTHLIKYRDVPVVEVLGDPRVFAVDLSALDPELIDPDEDMVAERFPEVVSIPPPRRQMEGEEEASGQEGERARWAGSIPDFDRSEVTERSLTEGRIAYRGTIPPAALALVDVRSPVLAGFLSGLSPEFREALPPSPPTSGWRSEVERGRIVATNMARGVLRTVGQQIPMPVADGRETRATADHLVRLSRTLGRGGKINEAAAAREARLVIEKLGEFDEHPVSDVDKAQDAAMCAARLADIMIELPSGGTEDAARIVAAAFEGGRSVVREQE